MEGSQILVETLNGDLAAFAELSRWEHSTLQEYAAQAGELILGPAAVRRVLLALQRGDDSPSLIQEWASLMRRGYLSDGYIASNGSRAPKGPIRGIGINYDSAAEEK